MLNVFHTAAAIDSVPPPGRSPAPNTANPAATPISISSRWMPRPTARPAKIALQRMLYSGLLSISISGEWVTRVSDTVSMIHTLLQR